MAGDWRWRPLPLASGYKPEPPAGRFLQMSSKFTPFTKSSRDDFAGFRCRKNPVRFGIYTVMDYRREIDGLRALAVLPVILFHAGLQAFSGGFVGVDVFFVISGYLITTTILAELEVGKFSIINFYERRARRILPALFFVLFVSLPFAWFWLFPQDMKSFSQSLVAVSAFSSNVLFWRESGYFDTVAELKPLLHTWSLAVEEQYYLFFPVFLMLTWRLGKPWILGLLAVVFGISLAAAQWGSSAQSMAAFFLLPTRGWELLVGAFVAFCLAKNSRPLNKVAGELGGIAGLSLIVYAIVVFDKNTPFPSLYTLAPTVGTALILLCTTQPTVVRKVLGNKCFVGVGIVSYSAYLWHQPLFAFARHRSVREPGTIMVLVLAIVTLLLAYFSWRFVETPFRNKDRFSRRTVFTYSVAGTVLFITIGLLGSYTNGFKFRHDVALLPKPWNVKCHGAEAISVYEDPLAECLGSISNER